MDSATNLSLFLGRGSDPVLLSSSKRRAVCSAEGRAEAPVHAAASCFAGFSSGSMTMYRRLPHFGRCDVPEPRRNQHQRGVSVGKAPTTRVRRRISRMMRSSGLLVRICRQ